MLRAFFMALAAVVSLPDRSCADRLPDRDSLLLKFHVADTGRRFGLLILAPVKMRCPSVRYQVAGAGRSQVSAALGPGELVVMPLLANLPSGMTTLRITALGCHEVPSQARRVILGASSPDHSWRALTVLADVEGDPLRKRQGSPVVQRIGRPPHVGFPGI